MALDGQYGAPATADRAWPLAAELAALMDEAARAEVDLAATLPDAADPGFAAHWQHTLRFLEIVTHRWPEWLQDNGLLGRRCSISSRCSTPRRRPGRSHRRRHRVWVAGTTGAIAAVASLLRVVARLPAGRVILPGLDLAMPDAAWDALEESHPQAGHAAPAGRARARAGAT